MCVHICTGVCIQVCVCKCVQMCVPIQICVYMCVHMCRCVYTHRHTCVYHKYIFILNKTLLTDPSSVF